MNKKAQNVTEYALVIAVVTVALLTMQTYFKRGVQSVVKVVADDYGRQGEPVGDIEYATKKKVYYEGYDGKGHQFAVTSKSSSTWTQTKTNLGDSNIKTETSGSTTLKEGQPSVLVSGDFRQRKVD